MKTLFLKVICHIIFWIGVLLFFTYIFGVDNTINANVFLFALFLMPITIGTTYVSIYNLIPNYLLKRHYHRFILYSIYTLIISVFGIFFSVFFGLAYLSDFLTQEVTAIGRNGLFILIAVYLVVLIVSAFKLLQLNLDQERQHRNLQSKFYQSELELKEQELNYLKMQIHPHFLFNTLNTIYGFALKKNDLAPDMILKLSSLLDYILYQINKPFVSIKEELDHIDDYIDLERMRFNDTLEIRFTKHIESDEVQLAPMLLIPFIENSFKHGSIINGKLKIDISVSSTHQSLGLKVKNTSFDASKIKEGIGLNNIKKRLAHLYPNSHQLHISSSNNRFEIELQLALNSNA